MFIFRLIGYSSIICSVYRFYDYFNYGDQHFHLALPKAIAALLLGVVLVLCSKKSNNY